MTTTEMRTWFDILQDKYNSPYFTTAEKDEFLLDAQWDIINETIGDLDTASSLEENKASTERIRTLVKSGTVATDGAGLIVNTHASFLDASGSQATPVAILSFAIASGVHLKAVSNNDIGKFQENTYKAGTTSYPNYTSKGDGYQTFPALNTTAIEALYIAEPTAIDDLPVRMHRKVVALGLVKTGLVTESEALTMMGKTTNG